MKRKKFLKKIIANSPEDLTLISALCSKSNVKQSNIKYLKNNKIFLITLERQDNESMNSPKKIISIVKFEYIENSKSKNINQNQSDKILNLLGIKLFKINNNYQILLLFSNNAAITLSTETIDVTLEDLEE
tara:strand:+ start:77 stop:469 length:393 start_codon:yes stop_codon:yes gene_type:complete